MATITFPGMTLTGDHASRPAASAVGKGTLYACTTHTLVYQSDGSSWATWFTGGSTVSYASNVNAVGEANAGGAATTLTRGDHVHLGVRSVAHASNTFSGPITLTAGSPIGITSPTAGTYHISSLAVAGGGTLTVADEGTPLSTAATTLDFVGSGVTASGTGATKTITIAGGSGGDMTRITETVLGGDAADITITGIPNTYRALRLHISARSAGGADFGTLNLRMGDGSIDTGATKYSSSRQIQGSGGASIGGRAGSLINLSTIAGDTATTGAFGYVEVTILNYKNTSMFKGILFQGYMDGASDHYQSEGGGQYRDASAEVDQIRIYADGGNNLKAGSYMTVYGIA